jgi:hypothetical protein
MMEPKIGDWLEESFLRCRDLDVPLADRLQAFANEATARRPAFPGSDRCLGQPPRGDRRRSNGS